MKTLKIFGDLQLICTLENWQNKGTDQIRPTDQEMLDAYKIIARTEGICSALEPMAAAAEVIFRQAKNKPKDYTICLSLCGRGEKDLDTIQEHIGKDFE